jgi:chloramphenicol-sensitive protein RarD
VIWGFVPIFFKGISTHDPYEIIYYRIIIAALAITIIIGIGVRNFASEISSVHKSSPKFFLWMILLNATGAILLLVNWISYVYVVNSISVNAGSFAYLILPIVTAFLAFFILKERLSLFRWIGISLSAISCYLIAHIDPNQVLYISIVTLSYSFYMITQRKNTYLSRKNALAIQMVLGAFIMIAIDPSPPGGPALDGHFWIFITIIAVVFTITPLLLNLFALNGMESSQLAFLIYVNPITSFLIGVLMYNEQLEAIAIAAYALQAFSIVIFNWDLILKVLEKSTGIKFSPVPIEVESADKT